MIPDIPLLQVGIYVYRHRALGERVFLVPPSGIMEEIHSLRSLRVEIDGVVMLAIENLHVNQPVIRRAQAVTGIEPIHDHDNGIPVEIFRWRLAQ